MSKKLKIGIVTDQLLAGGVQLAAIEQVKELNRLGHSAKLLILMRKKYATDFSYLVENVPHQYLSDSYPRFFRKTIKFPIFSFLSTLHLMSPIFASRIIKKKDYDILISLGTTTCLTTQAVFRKWKIPYIAIIHDPIEYILDTAYSQTKLKYFFIILKPLARFFERSFVHDAKQTVIISNVHYEYLKKHYGVIPVILPYGSNILSRIPRKRGTLLLSFGRWQKEKNPEFLLLLLEKIPSAKLIIAGLWIHQKELAQFRLLLKKKRIEKRVKLVPHFEKEELDDLCKQARVFIHPHFEAFGLAALEAAGHGVAIIIPEKSGATERFTHNIHGFFPKTVDVDEYTKYVKTLLSNERLAYKMGSAAWRIAKKMFSWDAHGNKLSSLCYHVLKAEQTHIVCIANAFVTKNAIGGGDQFLIELAKRAPNNVQLTIITPQLALFHWEKARILSRHIRLLSFSKNPLDNIDDPFLLFIAYCIRSIQTVYLLFKLPRFQSLHTATDLIPDTIPAFLYHRFHPEIPWTARFFHFIEHPLKRKGKMWVNAGAYLLQKLNLRLMRDANIVMVDNQNIKGDLLKKGFTPKQIELHLGGVATEEIANTQAREKFMSDALFIGRLKPHKGVIDAIDVWRYVVDKKRNAKLTIIGYGPAEIVEPLQNKIKDVGLEKNIFFTGHITNRKILASYYSSSKLLLFLDHEAGFGLVVAEAMAAGMPIIAYDLPIFGTIYKKGFLTAPIYDIASIAHCVTELLTDPKLYAHLSHDAKQEASRYDWSYASEQFYRSLLSLMNKSTN